MITKQKKEEGNFKDQWVRSFLIFIFRFTFWCEQRKFVWFLVNWKGKITSRFFRGERRDISRDAPSLSVYYFFHLISSTAKKRRDETFPNCCVCVCLLGKIAVLCLMRPRWTVAGAFVGAAHYDVTHSWLVMERSCGRWQELLLLLTLDFYSAIIKATTCSFSFTVFSLFLGGGYLLEKQMTSIDSFSGPFFFHSSKTMVPGDSKDDPPYSFYFRPSHRKKNKRERERQKKSL